MTRRAPQRLRWTKVERALRRLDVDPEAFLDAYEPQTRERAGGAAPTPGEIRAVERYQADRNLERLMRELGTRDHEAVDALIHRVVELEANAHVAAGTAPRLREDDRPGA